MTAITDEMVLATRGALIDKHNWFIGSIVETALTAALPHIEAAWQERSRGQQRHCYPQDRNDDPSVLAYCGASHDCPPAKTVEEIRQYGVCKRCHSLAMEATRTAERERIAMAIEAELGTNIFHPHYRYGMERAAAIARGGSDE